MAGLLEAVEEWMRGGPSVEQIEGFLASMEAVAAPSPRAAVAATAFGRMTQDHFAWVQATAGKLHKHNLAKHADRTYWRLWREQFRRERNKQEKGK